MANIDYIDDWAARLRTRLYTQFRDATTWQQWCDEVLGPQVQALEDAAQTMLSIIDVAASEGAQLDVIGRIVGQPRPGSDDETYRTYIAVRILANRSAGTPEEIYSIVSPILEVPLVYFNGGNKEFVIDATAGSVTPALAEIAMYFIRIAKEAGARAILHWTTYPEAVFKMDTGIGGLDSGLDSGVWSIAKQV